MVLPRAAEEELVVSAVPVAVELEEPAAAQRLVAVPTEEAQQEEVPAAAPGLAVEQPAEEARQEAELAALEAAEVELSLAPSWVLASEPSSAPAVSAALEEQHLSSA